MKIGLIRERKQPVDMRVALTPEQCTQIMSAYPGLEIVVESSPDRKFTDPEYRGMGITVSDSLKDCDVLIGIKEVPEKYLIPEKKYFLFSHTIKQQHHNREMFKAILAKKIELVDFECLNWPDGRRILGFGRWAGIIGTYNAFLTWGKRQQSYLLKPAWQCFDLGSLKSEIKKIKPGKIKIALTGNGRVASGALELLTMLNIRWVTPADFLTESFDEPVYTNLKNKNLYRRKDGKRWDRKDFFRNHQNYECIFKPYLSKVDLLINGLYWEPDMAQLFQKEDTKKEDFKIQVVADITCDLEGSVPITVKSTTIDEPVFGWDKRTQIICEPYLKTAIDIMAVGNLPAELPRDASEDFGSDIAKHIIPMLMNNDPDGILERGTLTKNGRLNKGYEYLADYGNLFK
jgi:alanine dehydrogenase